MCKFTQKAKLTAKVGHDVTLTDYYLSDGETLDWDDAVGWSQTIVAAWRKRFEDFKEVHSISLTLTERY